MRHQYYVVQESACGATTPHLPHAYRSSHGGLTACDGSTVKRAVNAR